MKAALLLMVLVPILFTGCKKDESGDVCGQDSDYLIYGTYCPCCETVFSLWLWKIEDGKLYKNIGESLDGCPYAVNWEQLPAEKYDRVKDLPCKIPMQLLRQPSGNIGSPYCVQNILQIKKFSVSRCWVINPRDTANVPAYVRAFIDTLNKY